MPATINGIGTRYSGKHNIQQRVGVCRSCGRNATLLSYDTRLFFVVVFIPIIPLGRKRIIDQCSACRRHFVVDMAKWEMARQLETSGALEKFRSEPTVENAIQAHQQLIGFHQIAEAAELQQTIEQKFSDNARALVYLAGVQLHLGKATAASTLFSKALTLRPDLPEARIGVANEFLRTKHLDEARKMLDFLEKTGAAQLYNLGPLENLARAFQAASRHAEAVELFAKLLEALPALGQNPHFRKWVKTSEKALRAKTTILPKAKFSLRNFLASPLSSQAAGRRTVTRKQALIGAGIIVVIALVFALIGSFAISRSQTLCVVNGTDKLYQGEITELGKVRIYPGANTFHVKEGHYTAKFDPPCQSEIKFDILSKFMDRFTYHPVWVLNPDGEAIIANQRVVYARTKNPGSFTFDYGKKLNTYMDIRYPFTTPPATMQMSSSQSEITVGALQFFRGTAVEAFNTLVGAQKFNDAYRLAEWRLGQFPDDRKMLDAYLSASATHNDLARYAEFLKGGLNARPIRVEWHRSYQNLLLGSDKQRLIHEYDAMLATNTSDSDLLYLRGRLCDSDSEGNDYFNRSHEANLKNPYPAYALAFNAESQANWTTAKMLMDNPVRNYPDNVEFAASWSIACLGLNDVEELEQEWRRRASEDPVDLTAALNLCQALVLEQKTNEAVKAISAYSRAVGTRYGTSAQQMGLAANYNLSYFLGDFASMEKTAKDDKSILGRGQLYIALIEQNRPEEAEKFLPISDPEMAQWTELLPMALAWNLAGNPTEAVRWERRAAELLRKSGDKKHIENWIAQKVTPTPESIKALDIAAPTKALFLADLMYTYPEHRAEFAEMARKLNVGRMFPHHLIERAVAAP